jgi:uncharacterized protein (TIGR02996 family)
MNTLPMTTEEELLRRAVAEQPEDDTPRLALADWLDEQGDEVSLARAEFIRLQIMLYRAGDATPDMPDARRRAAELLDRYRGAWGFPATGQLRSRCVIRRGFVDELWAGGEWDQIGTPSDVLDLLPHHPVTRIRLSGFRPGGPDVFETFESLEVPAFRKVRHLHVSSEQWIDELVGRLLGLGHFPELESLAFIGTGITPIAVRDIAECPRLGRLRTLRIGFAGPYWLNPREHVYRGVRDEGARMLADSDVLAELRELSLRASGMGPHGAYALAESATLTKLERLTLTENPDIDKDARATLRARYGDRVYL